MKSQKYDIVGCEENDERFSRNSNGLIAKYQSWTHDLSENVSHKVLKKLIVPKRKTLFLGIGLRQR